MAVVGFDNFNVIARCQGFGRHLQELQSHVHAHTHIGRHHDGNVLGRLRNLGFLAIGKTGRSNHHRDSVGAAYREVGHRPLRAGKVNQNAAVLKPLGDIGGNQHPCGLTGKRTRIVADGRACSDIQSAAENAIIGRTYRVNQHLPHAP